MNPKQLRTVRYRHVWHCRPSARHGLYVHTGVGPAEQDRLPGSHGNESRLFTVSFLWRVRLSGLLAMPALRRSQET